MEIRTNSPLKLDDFLIKWPSLVLENVANKDLVFYGNVMIKRKWYRISLICPKFPFVVNIKLKVEHSLNVYYFSGDAPKLNKSWDVTELLMNLPNLIEDTFAPVAEHLSIHSLPSMSESCNVYADVAKLSSGPYKMSINKACTRVSFTEFKGFENHYLDVERTEECSTFHILAHSLPDNVSWNDLFRSAQTIEVLLNTFLKCQEDLRSFYENLSYIDDLCYVVQPVKPSTKDNWRIFLLKDHVYLKIVISEPFAASSSVTVHIIGPTNEVENFRYVVSDGLQNWDGELDIHKNLLRIFELPYFPMVCDTEKADLFCNICYSYELEGHIPIVSCDSDSCNLVFHAICLKEWFTTLSDGKVFLDVSFGSCPFCKEKLSTSFDELLK